MNSKFLLIPFSLIILASCSTAYKTGQTPDDVYYSPARFYGEERQTDNKKEEDVRRDYAEERQIRMSINDPRWRYFDNDIYYSPYSYGYNYGYYYNPYYCTLPVYNPIVVKAPNPINSTPRKANLGGYTTSYNNNNSNNFVGTKAGTYRPSSATRTFNNSNSNSNTGSKLGNTLNKIFNNSNSSSNNSNSSSNSTNTSSSGTRSYTPSSSSSSSSGSSSSGSSSSSSRPARKGG